jgi:hypothetical protein
MLHKCANPPCVSLFRSMRQGKLFMVESGPQERKKDSQYSIPASAQRKHRTPRMEHYWLCDKCSPLVTLTFAKGLGLIMVPLTPPQANLDERKKPMNSVQVSELLPSRPVGRQEMA